MDFPKGLSGRLNRRKADGTLRELALLPGGIDFFSNDYLGFANSASLKERLDRAVSDLDLPLGSTGSRLISGNSPRHEQLEIQIAEFFRAPSSLLFNSGYDANLGLLSSVAGREDLVFYDALSHASLRDGIRLSGARAYGFRHNDLNDLEKKLRNAKPGKGQAFLVVESVYSMDGDRAPLEELVGFAESNGLLLIVDEAHATGVYGALGQGLVSELGLERRVFARVHTFGKALGAHGAAVLGSGELRDFLVNFSRPFIYSTALPAHSVLSASWALEELAETEELKRLRDNIGNFRAALIERGLAGGFIDSDSPIQSFLCPGVSRSRVAASRLIQNGFLVKAILAPTVPAGSERIRFSIHSFNTYRQIREVLDLLVTFA